MKPQLLPRPALTTADAIRAIAQHLTQHRIRVKHEIGSEAHTEVYPDTKQPTEDADEETQAWRRAFALVRGSGARRR